MNQKGNLQIETEKQLAVFLTALPVEYMAVRSHLIDVREHVHPNGTIYERGVFVDDRSDPWEVILGETGAGNAAGAIEAERAISSFNPNLLVFVGVAGGIKDVRLGDVVVATKVYGYETGKDTSDRFLPRATVGASAYSLVQRARAEARRDDWTNRLSNPPESIPRVHIGPIASGDKVIASQESAVAHFLSSAYSDAIAVEMEGHGFIQAAHANEQVKSLVIRGVSDLLSNKSASDGKGYQSIASRHASAFAFQLLASLRPSKHGRIRWILTLDIDANAPPELLEAILREIRDRAADSSVQLIRVTTGSLVLELESSRDAQARFQDTILDKPTISGASILRLVVEGADFDIAQNLKDSHTAAPSEVETSSIRVTKESPPTKSLGIGIGAGQSACWSIVNGKARKCIRGPDLNPHVFSMHVIQRGLVEIQRKLAAAEGFDSPDEYFREFEVVTLSLPSLKTRQLESLGQRAIKPFLRPNSRLNIVDEVDAGIAGGTYSRNGICAYSGVGASVTFGIDDFDRRTAKIDGWGPLIGDYGSGFNMAVDLLKEIGRSYDLGLVPTMLDELLEFVPELVSMENLQEWFDNLVVAETGWKARIADLSQVIINAADRSDPDPYAVKLVQKNAMEMADSISIGLRRFGSLVADLPIVCQGRVFLGSRMYFESVKRRLAKEFNNELQLAKHNELFGAGIISQRLDEGTNRTAVQKLIDSVSQLPVQDQLLLVNRELVAAPPRS